MISKTYGNIIFTNSSKPVLANGSICWAEKPSNDDPVMYRIPAL